MLNRGFATEIKVGLFTAIGLGALAVAIVVLDGNPFAAKAQEFYTVLDNVAGVAARTGVRVSGVQIGEVSSVELLPKGAKVNFTVDPKVKIPKGSFIELRSRGILGDVFLEIVRDENNKDSLQSGDMIPKVKEQNDLNSLMSSIGSIAKNIQLVSHTLALVLGNEEGQASLRNIIHNIEQITSDARDLVYGERKNISATIRGMKEVAERLAMTLEKNDGRLDRVLESVDVASQDFKTFAGALRQMVSGDNKGKLEGILASIDDSMNNIKETSAKVKLVADKVERGEGTIGALLSKDDTINEVNSTLKDVKEFLRPATQLKVDLDYHGEYRGKAATDTLGFAGSHFNVRLRTRPDRYYLLGITDSPASRQVSTEDTQTKTEGNNTSTRTVKKVSEDAPRIKVNAQFAKRFDHIGVRFGIFESYAGIAGDLYLFSDKFQGSVEVFDVKNTSTRPLANKTFDPRIKSYANLFVTPNIYLTGGVDAINNVYAIREGDETEKPKPLPFVGAGLRFTDDDLRAVMGAASFLK